MNIAIDYDGTWTLDPPTWAGVVDSLTSQGHRVWCVTKRYEDLAGDIRATMRVPIVYVQHGQAKHAACAERGIVIDVWIDNSPASIMPRSLWPRPKLHMPKKHIGGA